MNPAAPIEKPAAVWASEVAANLAYVAVMGALLLLLVPAARELIQNAARRHVWHWRYGRWALEWDALPEWRKEILRARGMGPGATAGVVPYDLSAYYAEDAVEEISGAGGPDPGPGEGPSDPGAPTDA